MERKTKSLNNFATFANTKSWKHNYLKNWSVLNVVQLFTNFAMLLISNKTKITNSNVTYARSVKRKVKVRMTQHNVLFVEFKKAYLSRYLIHNICMSCVL
jgi:hypothetical protein